VGYSDDYPLNSVNSCRAVVKPLPLALLNEQGRQLKLLLFIGLEASKDGAHFTK
jgi:hypothetical protein